jgi:serine/threonine protein kinase
MDPERWQRIEEIYHSALEHEPAERTAFLAEACHSDADLRREVEGLLAQKGSLFDRPAWELADLKPGSRFGTYEIISKLGEGGMGVVYRARDSKLNRTVAIKVLPALLAHDPGRLARFEREAKVLAALNHPNIAQIYSVEDRALVMELVEGETLKGPLPLETALDYGRQIAEALATAHDKGIIHRDLKPENIKVTPQGIVKVLDFGLAAIRPESDVADVVDDSPALAKSPTTAGMILGTAAYMAPEQARGQTVDKRAEVWAFGCVVYEMLTGRQAFPGQTISDSLAAVLTRETDLDAVPPSARRMVQTCLEKDPKRRPQAIGDWRLLVESVEPPRKTASIRMAWTAAAVLGLTLIVVSFLYFRTAPVPAQQVRFQIQAPEQTTFGNAFALSPDGRQIGVHSGQLERRKHALDPAAGCIGRAPAARDRRRCVPTLLVAG